MIENIDCSKEIWKAIEGYEGLYEVSNFGRVRAFNYDILELKGKYRTWRHYDVYYLPAGAKAKDHRYVRIRLRKDGESKSFSLHRLVAQAFIPNPNNLPIVNHKDENPANNRADNLEWCTHQYNVNYGTARERAKKTVLLNQRKALCSEFGESLATEEEQKLYAEYLNTKRGMNVKPEFVAFIPSSIRDEVLI